MKRPSGVGLERAETAGLEHVQRVGRVAVFEQHRAAGQREPFEFAFEFGEGCRIEVAEQRHIAQQFAACRTVLRWLAVSFIAAPPLPLRATC